MTTSANSSALSLPGAPGPARKTPRDAASLVEERLAARHRRVRMIRRWTVTFAVTLFIAVAALIIAESHLVAAWSTSRSAATSGGSSSAGVSASSSSAASSGNTSSSSAGSSSALTTGQS